MSYVAKDLLEGTWICHDTVNMESLIAHPAEQTENEVQRSDGKNPTWNLQNEVFR